jgi:uncharacterized membrane protein
MPHPSRHNVSLQAESSVHEHGLGDVSLGPTPPRVRNRLIAVLAPLVLATFAGIVLLWPAQGDIGNEKDKAVTVTGKVTDIHECDADLGLPEDCISATVRLSDSDGGEDVEAGLPYGAHTPTVEVGDKVVLSYAKDAPVGQQYVWADFDRTNPLLILIVVFVMAVIFLSRWEGVGSLFSLAVSLAVIFVFVLPALGNGEDPLLVAVTAASFILIVALFTTHGFNAMTSSAVIGTLIALAITAVLGLAFTSVMHFTGLTDETNRILVGVLPDVQFEGLLLAGLIIGALGVLDDVTVTQAAAVWEIAAADRRMTRPALFSRAMRIGRAHVSATVNTLVLAYAGASLPLLLMFTAVNENGFKVGLTDGVSQEIVRGLVGSLGIIAAVPITTAVAASVAAAIVTQGSHRHRR